MSSCEATRIAAFGLKLQSTGRYHFSMVDSSLGWWIIGTVVLSLFMVGLRSWAPKAGARRVAERGTLVGAATRPTFQEESLARSGLEMQNLANRRLHDDMLEEASRMKLRARAGDVDERAATVLRAIHKVEDALVARPGSYEGTKLLGELFLDLALLDPSPAAVAPLQRAAELFAEAGDLRKGVIDNYIGRGWSYLRMCDVDPEFAATYAPKAVDAFAAGFARVPQNVWVLRGWGLALDRLARSADPDPDDIAAGESSFRDALRAHRSGEHDLSSWYSQIRSAATPVWLDVPPIDT